MRAYQLQTIAACPVGSKLDGYITAKVKKVWQRKTGQGQHGDWSLQDVICSDSSMAEFKVTFSGFEKISPKELEGREITLEPSEGKKGMAGLIVSEYNENIFLKVTDSANIFVDGEPYKPGDDEEQQESVPERQQPRQQERQQPRQQQRQQPAEKPRAPERQQQHEEQPRQQGQGELKSLRQALGSYMTVWRYCYDAAAALANDIHARHHHILPSGTIGIIADKFFIEAARGGFCRSVPFVAESDMQPLKTKPVGELMKNLEAAIADFKERAASDAFTRQQPPEKPRSPERQQQHEEQPRQQQQGESFADGMTDDEIPF